jgi:hypothetical protein
LNGEVNSARRLRSRVRARLRRARAWLMARRASGERWSGSMSNSQMASATAATRSMTGALLSTMTTGMPCRCTRPPARRVAGTRIGSSRTVRPNIRQEPSSSSSSALGSTPRSIEATRGTGKRYRGYLGGVTSRLRPFRRSRNHCVSSASVRAMKAAQPGDRPEEGAQEAKFKPPVPQAPLGPELGMLSHSVQNSISS